MIATCSGCDRRWTTTGQAHCGTCHHHFRNVGGFDRHRRGGTCLSAAQMQSGGLEQRDGTWATPEGHEDAQRSREALESARQREVSQ